MKADLNTMLPTDYKIVQQTLISHTTRNSDNNNTIRKLCTQLDDAWNLKVNVFIRWLLTTAEKFSLKSMMTGVQVCDKVYITYGCMCTIHCYFNLIIGNFVH